MTPLRKALKVAALVLVGAVLAVPAIFVNTIIGYAPVLFYAFLLATCYGYCRLSARAVSFDLMAGRELCTRGQSVEFKLRVGNASPLFLFGVKARFSVHDLFGTEATSEDIALNVAARGTRDFEFGLGLPHVGTFTAGVDTVTARDPLGIFQRTMAVSARHDIVVAPRSRDVDALTFSTARLVESPEAIRSARSDGGDYASVREYEQGDPLKSIHWKLSAHSDGYLTKLYENSTEPRLDVYMNFAAPEGSDSESLMELNDGVLETALALAAFAREQGVESSAVYLGKDGQIHRVHPGRRLDPRELLVQVPLMGSQDNAGFLDELRSHARALHAADNVALCSAVFDGETARALGQVRASGRRVSLFALVPSSLDSDERTRALAQLRAFDGSDVSCHVADDQTEVLR